MRPTPERRPPEESGRIIYIGDVRRRRAFKARSPDRQYLAAALLIALVGWVAWLIVLFTLPPTRLLTYLAFFVPLWAALAASGAVAWYAFEWKRGVLPGLRLCARRGVLTASVIVANLAFVAAHGWMLPIAALSIGAAIAVDAALVWRTR